MKLKTIVTINTGLYMDIRPEIEIDTENYEETKKLIQELHTNFHGLLNGLPKKTEIDMINMDIESQKEYTKTDFKMQNLFDKIRRGESIPVEVWQSLSISDQNILHKAQLQYNAEVRANKKL